MTKKAEKAENECQQLAEVAKFITGQGGILHTDNLGGDDAYLYHEKTIAAALATSPAMNRQRAMRLAAKASRRMRGIEVGKGKTGFAIGDTATTTDGSLWMVVGYTVDTIGAYKILIVPERPPLSDDEIAQLLVLCGELRKGASPVYPEQYKRQ